MFKRRRLFVLIAVRCFKEGTSLPTAESSFFMQRYMQR